MNKIESNYCRKLFHLTVLFECDGDAQPRFKNQPGKHTLM